MKIKNIIKPTLHLILFVILTFSIGLSACAPQTPPAVPEAISVPDSTEFAVTESPIFLTYTAVPTLEITINSFSYSFNQSPQIIDHTLWLPAREVFELLERPDINETDTYISSADYDLNQIFKNCHFPVGGKSYSPDTENNIWIESELEPFIQGNAVYLTEKMLEDCIGDFIQFDFNRNKVDLRIKNKEISQLQSGNSNPISFIHLKEIEELDDSRIGCLVSGCVNNPASDWIGWANTLKADGFSRARITLNASDGPAVNSNLVGIEKEIPPEYAAVYRKLKELGITTRYSLSFWDLDYRQNGGEISHSRLKSGQEVDRYLEYVRMVVTSLKGLVSEYELWNEPDANSDWYQRIDPEVYVEVAKRAIPIIREIDPQAKIVLISSSSYIDQPVQEYSKVILESDILPLADAISLHTVNNDASPVFKNEYYYGYDKMWQNIKKTAEENGFSGEYYADELNYRSNYSLAVLQPEPGEYHPYEPIIAAKYIGRMIAINLGMDISVGTSGTNSTGRPIEGKMIRNMAYLLDHLQAVPFPVEVQSKAARIRYYTFEDSQGDLYITLWNDGEAKMNDEDIEALLLVKNVTADSVTAINPYLLNEQILNFENASDGVAVDQILLKDYPILYILDLP